MEEVDIFIRDYFNGKLNEEEIRQFQEKYDRDPKFKKEADQIELEIIGIRAHGRETLKKTFNKWEEEASSHEATKSFPFFKLGLAASVLIAIVFVGKWALRPTPEDIYIAYYEPYENFEYTTTRDETDPLKTDKEKAYTSYDTHKYEMAAAHFLTHLKETPQDYASTFFLAICQMELGDLEEAKLNLTELEKQNIPYYTDAALWYLSLIEIKEGKIEMAKTRLGKLKSKKDYNTKVSEILNSLN